VVLGEMFSSIRARLNRITFYASHLRTAECFVPLVILVVIGLLINQLGTCGGGPTADLAGVRITPRTERHP